MLLLIRVNRFNVLTVVFAVAHGSIPRELTFSTKTSPRLHSVNVAKLTPLKITGEKKVKDVDEQIKKLEGNLS